MSRRVRWLPHEEACFVGEGLVVVKFQGGAKPWGWVVFNESSRRIASGESSSRVEAKRKSVAVARKYSAEKGRDA